MHLKVFVKLKKALKTLSSEKKTQKKTKKNQKTHWAGFFFNPGFFQPCKQEYQMLFFFDPIFFLLIRKASAVFITT